MICMRESHEAVKLDEAAWVKLAPHLPMFDGMEWIEQRHCKCGSTLARAFPIELRKWEGDVMTIAHRGASGSWIQVFAADGLVAVEMKCSPAYAPTLAWIALKLFAEKEGR